MNKSIFIVITFLLLSGCMEKKEKPPSVPQKAIWKGGIDGGCWIAFELVKEDSIKAIIFYEDGSEWKKGVFVRIGDCQILESKIVKDIDGFDGEKLLLKNNSCIFKKME